MKCRVVFPNAKDFKTLDNFFDYAKQALSDNATGQYAANFFLFGEDVLGVYKLCKPAKRELIAELLFGDLLIREREERRAILKERMLVPHEAVLKLAGRLQKILRPEDFVIFSAFAKVHGNLMNAVYLVGKDQQRFDFKRTAADGDLAYIDRGLHDLWLRNSWLNLKTTKCVKAGGTCIKGIHLLVCADIALLQRPALTKTAAAGENIVFIPVYGLPAKEVRRIFLNLHKAGFRGHIFINDQENGWAFSAHLGSGKGTVPQFTKFKGKKYLYAEFETEPQEQQR